MIYYMCTEENKGYFEMADIEVKIVGGFQKVSEFSKTMRHFMHYHPCIAFSMRALQQNTDEDIIDLFTSVKDKFHKKVIVVVEKEVRNFQKMSAILRSSNVDNIVCGNTVEEIRESVLRCVSPEGMSHVEMQERLRALYESTTESPLVGRGSATAYQHSLVGIFGIGDIDVTSYAFNLSYWLSSRAVNVSYLSVTEEEQEKMIRFVERRYDRTFQEEKFSEGRITFFKDINFNDQDVVIMNFGGCDIETFQKIQENVLCQKSLVVMHSRMWELQQALSRMRETVQYMNPMDYFLIPRNGDPKLQEVFSSFSNKVFVSYPEDVCNIRPNIEAYEKVLSDILRQQRV